MVPELIICTVPQVHPLPLPSLVPPFCLLPWLCWCGPPPLLECDFGAASKASCKAMVQNENNKSMRL